MNEIEKIWPVITLIFIFATVTIFITAIVNNVQAEDHHRTSDSSTAISINDREEAGVVREVSENSLGHAINEKGLEPEPADNNANRFLMAGSGTCLAAGMIAAPLANSRYSARARFRRGRLFPSNSRTRGGPS